ncbi:Cationic amino acid transporter 2 [Frankliniella fusca]|uniref:Cationic amino acid transporter 2 n=1 Tax=Frankliniella fusca TaxID=407009 RepID=A0AAE1GW09_9NEOP|nr:Cationic amino acid transporter 2 [Frankliniella fusca]
MALASLWRAMTRRKVVDLSPSSPTPSTSGDACSSSSSSSSPSGSPLARVLTTFDLTALGVGSTLGVGVYVLAGSVARDAAGPAVIISFAVAAVASIFAGLCYAEFGSRVPLAGSAYIYSYVSIGEFMAFVIGWNLIMEYVIGCASVARGLSNYLDQLFDNVMQETFQSFVHLHVSFLSPYIDFFAFVISFLLSVVLAFGVKESMSLNNVFTAINMAVVLFVIVAGAFNADISNWQIDPAQVAPDVAADHKLGKGGFFPFGVMGVLRGAATCFYGFIGFDCIATTGEEVKNPKKAIPVSIILSLVIIFLAYFGVSAVLTLMWPYYLQDPDAPLPFVFKEIGWPYAQWTVAIGGIFGLFASLFGAMYPLPRVIYAMANDGLIFKFLGEVHPKYKTPLVGTLLAGLITGIMAALFKLQQLVAMLSFGTLVAYTIVAACVLLLRYRCYDSDETANTDFKETTNLVSLKEKPTVSKVLAQVFNSHGLKHPTAVTSRLVSILVVLYCGLSIALGLCLVHMEYGLMYGQWGPLSLVCVISSLLLIVILSMALQPSSNMDLPFKVPFVPVIPALSILLNIYLILMSDAQTCIRFGIWMAVGVPVGLFFIAPVMLYFISLACRSLNYCGSPSTFNARPHAVAKVSSLPETNGVPSFNATKNNGIENFSFVKEMAQSKESLVVEKCSIEVNIQCATPIPTDSSSEDFASSDAQSVDPTNHDIFVKLACSVETAPVVESVERLNSDETSSLDELSVSNSDDSTSITDVANDLLSIIQQNEIAVNTSNTSLKSVTEDKDDCIKSKCAFDACVTLDIEDKLSELSKDPRLVTVEDCDEDVRSLYPDVVVISSSEEDTQSQRSSISNSFKAVEKDNLLQDLDQQTSTIDVTASCSNVSEQSNQNLNLSPQMSETEITPDGRAVNISEPSNVNPPVTESSEISSVDCETASPFKNINFVKSLEKIIGAQTLKIKALSRPPLSKSISMISMVPLLELSVPPSNAAESENAKSSNEAKHNCAVEDSFLNSVSHFDINCNEDNNEDRGVSDIKSKLEIILSNSISSSSTPPTSKLHLRQISELTDNDSSNTAETSENKDAILNVVEKEVGHFHANEIEETKKRMSSVLGAIRLRHQNAEPAHNTDTTTDLQNTKSEVEDETRKCMSCELQTLKLHDQNQQISS